MEAHLGTLETNKLADLVITDVDPLTDIASLADPANISVVVKAGTVLRISKAASRTSNICPQHSTLTSVDLHTSRSSFFALGSAAPPTAFDFATNGLEATRSV